MMNFMNYMTAGKSIAQVINEQNDSYMSSIKAKLNHYNSIIENVIMTEIKKYLIDNFAINYVDVYELSTYRFEVVAELSYMDNDNKRVFASDISIRFKSEIKYDDSPAGDPMMYINVGTCGEYNREDKSQVIRVMQVANLWENVKAIEKAVATVKNQYAEEINEITKLRREMTHKVSNLVTETKDNFSAFVKETIFTGLDNYKFKFNTNSTSFAIIKVMNKNVRLSDYFNNSNLYNKDSFIEDMYYGRIRIVND